MPTTLSVEAKNLKPEGVHPLINMDKRILRNHDFENDVKRGNNYPSHDA